MEALVLLGGIALALLIGHFTDNKDEEEIPWWQNSKVPDATPTKRMAVNEPPPVKKPVPSATKVHKIDVTHLKKTTLSEKGKEVKAEPKREDALEKDQFEVYRDVVNSSYLTNKEGENNKT